MPTIPPRALILLAVLTLVWGTNWPLFAYALREISIWTFRAVTMVVAGAVLLAVSRALRMSIAIPRQHWPTVAIAALANLAVWNVASAYAAVLIPSGQAAVLGFTMPLWAALISWAVLGERLTGRMLLAIAFGAAAVGALMLRGVDAYARAPLGFALGLVAGIGWAGGTLLLKRRPVGVPATVLTGWQLLLGAIPIGAVALAVGDHHWFVPTTSSLLVIGYITLVPMALGNACWFAIVGMLPANVAGLSSILVPVVAMLSGAVVHGEPLGPLQWLAMGCCAVALALAVLKPRGANPS